MNLKKETIAIAILRYIITNRLTVNNRDVDAAILAANNAIDIGKSGSSAYEIGIRQIDMLDAGRQIKTASVLLA